MKRIVLRIKKIMHVFWKLLLSNDVDISIQRPFYFRWMLQGSYYNAFIKVFILFSTIWIIGFFITDSEHISTIKNDAVTVKYGPLVPNLIDTLKIADNLLKYEFKKISYNKISYSISFNNSKITPNRIRIKKILELTKINSNEFQASDEVIICARHLSINLHLISNNTVLKFKVRGFGFLDDIPNYLLIMGLIIAFILFKALADKFIYAFTGREVIKHIFPFVLDKENGLIKILNLTENEKDYKKRMKSVLLKLSLGRNSFRFCYIPFMIVILTIAVVLSARNIIYSDTVEGNWNFSPDMFYSSYIYNQLKDIFIFGIIIPPLLFKLFIIFWYTFRLSFEFDKKGLYKINPVSFDNAGGLSPLGEVTLFLFYMFIVFFPHVYGAAYLLNFPTHLQILLPLYLLFTFLLFFLPLSSPHSSMKKARNKMLSDISEQYNSLNQKYLERIRCDSDANFDDLYEKMKKVKKLYTERKKMPVWPYDFEIFVKFGAVFITNLIIYLSQYIISLLK